MKNPINAPAFASVNSIKFDFTFELFLTLKIKNLSVCLHLYIYIKTNMLDAPVEGHSCQGEDARVHGEEDDEVHDLTHHRTEHPLIQGVDGGLEGHAEDDEAQIRDPEVEDEQVGGLGVHLTVPEQNRQHQRIPHGAHQEDEREAQRDDHRLRSP